ncbi:hypothetical protein ElyMa_001511400 [Elysia marginata]|uniref:Uncharacterized protein n=1 Tax=Elysia marginata TaxID=1093978 RepID=A0AAV4J9L3_9GAST|nr:hypothetical protein ElyMa_001511400 [Elysia marginata]
MCYSADLDLHHLTGDTASNSVKQASQGDAVHKLDQAGVTQGPAIRTLVSGDPLGRGWGPGDISYGQTQALVTQAFHDTQQGKTIGTLANCHTLSWPAMDS